MNLKPEQPNSFVYTLLTDRQRIEGSTLTQEQRLVIQNERATIAEQLLGLTLDLQNPQEFLKTQANLQGQLAILKWLIEAADAAEAVLIDLSRRETDQQ